MSPKSILNQNTKTKNYKCLEPYDRVPSGEIYLSDLQLLDNNELLYAWDRQMKAWGDEIYASYSVHHHARIQDEQEASASGSPPDLPLLKSGDLEHDKFVESRRKIDKALGRLEMEKVLLYDFQNTNNNNANDESPELSTSTSTSLKPSINDILDDYLDN